jgi:16S rRNA (cytosine1402-N4)-methyltransferase
MVELHLPVMEKEVLHYLCWKREGLYVDATVGDGGHAGTIVSNLLPTGRLIGIDWDAAALERAKRRLSHAAEQVKLIHENYINLEKVLEELGCTQVDGILIDLGASTLQLMDPGRGFSFHQESDLDMRMDQRRSLTAAYIINEYSEEELAELFFQFGEERWSRRIAAAIVREKNKEGPLKDSKRLSNIIKTAVPARYRRQGGHPARRVFQALRLAVNSELQNIKMVLPQAVKCLSPKGRLCVIAYHSLEDRIVKQLFREAEGHCICPPERPCVCNRKPLLKVLTGKAVKPGEDEIRNNPRARSARLRAAEKI